MFTPQSASQATEGGPDPSNAQIWNSLKTAISQSSGYQRWKRELSVAEVDRASTEQLVQRYLRDTLATLAY